MYCYPLQAKYTFLADTFPLSGDNTSSLRPAI